MKHLAVLAALLLSAHCKANDVIEAPFNLQLQNTRIPREMADILLLRDLGYTKYTLHPDSRFEQFFVSRNNVSEEYVCSIPPEGSTFPETTNQTDHNPQLDSEILAKGMEVVHNSFSQSSCVWAYDLRGFYWTYGYCHGDKIIQYHETAPPQERLHKHVPGSPKMVYVLGRFSKASNNEIRFTNQASPLQYFKYLQSSEGTFRLVSEKLSPFSHQSQKVIMQMATDGSLCDMTWQPRLTEIVYKCNANGGKRVQIIDVEEIKTCHYRMFIHVPALCQLESFVPNKVTQHLVDVTCQRVSDEAGYSIDTLSTFEEYLDHPIFRQDSVFPVRADNRINVAQHDMIALGKGFYLGTVGNYQSESEYFNNRNVLLFNGFYELNEDLNMQVGRIIFNSIGKNLLAPEFVKGEQVLLLWLHSFIMWFEVYNFKGEFIGLSRLEHDGTKEQTVLGAQLFDPVTLLDVDGDDQLAALFTRPHYEAPHNMWNFEMFLSHGKSPKLTKEKPKPKDESLVQKTKMVIVYNEGQMENGRPNIAVYDEDADETLPGAYNDRGEYLFELEVSPQQTETFTAPQVPDVEFVGYPVLYYVKRLATENADVETTTLVVTQTLEQDSTETSNLDDIEETVDNQDSIEATDKQDESVVLVGENIDLVDESVDLVDETIDLVDKNAQQADESVELVDELHVPKEEVIDVNEVPVSDESESQPADETKNESENEGETSERESEKHPQDVTHDEL